MEYTRKHRTSEVDGGIKMVVVKVARLTDHEIESANANGVTCAWCDNPVRVASTEAWYCSAKCCKQAEGAE